MNEAAGERVRFLSIREDEPERFGIGKGIASKWVLRRGRSEVKRYGKCMKCLEERREKITGPKVELVREEPDAEWLPMPSERQWRDGVRRRRG